MLKSTALCGTKAVGGRWWFGGAAHVFVEIAERLERRSTPKAKPLHFDYNVSESLVTPALGLKSKDYKRGKLS